MPVLHTVISENLKNTHTHTHSNRAIYQVHYSQINKQTRQFYFISSKYMYMKLGSFVTQEIGYWTKTLTDEEYYYLYYNLFKYGRRDQRV